MAETGEAPGADKTGNGSGEWCDQVLVERLAATTRGLKHLFYLNLALAVAVIFFVAADLGSLSTRVDGALKTWRPLVQIHDYLRAAADKSDLSGALDGFGDRLIAFVRLQNRVMERLSSWQPSDAEQAAINRNFTSEEKDRLEKFRGRLVRTGRMEDPDRLRSIIRADFRTASLQAPIFEFQLILFYLDTTLRAQQEDVALLRRLDRIIPMGAARLPADPAAHLDFAAYLTTRVPDAKLRELVDGLPRLAETVGAGIVLGTACELKNMAPCTYAEIENWEKEAGRRGRQVTLPVLDVDAERGVVVFLAPLVLLVTLHLFLAQHRRREVLRGRLARRLGADALVLSDEPWLFTNLAVLSPGRWFAPNIARGVLFVFLLVGEAAALIGMGAAIASISWDILVDAVLSLTMEANPQSFATVGLDPDALRATLVHGLAWRYAYVALAGLAVLAGAIGIFRLWRDQISELRRVNG